MSDSAAARRIPPTTNELELSLFGPGIGESLVIHLGNGDWIVVDSCFDEQRQAVALSYLESLGVDVSTQVKLVLVTHWHDDHICGISQVVAAARTAEFACSAALDGQEFFNLVAARKEVSLVGQTSGVEEFESILDIIAGRASGRYPPGPDHWAASGMCLFSRRDPWIVKVISFSPSAHTITASKHQLAALFPVPGAAIKKLPALTPNDLAVVLRIAGGSTAVAWRRSRTWPRQTARLARHRPYQVGDRGPQPRVQSRPSRVFRCGFRRNLVGLAGRQLPCASNALRARSVSTAIPK